LTDKCIDVGALIVNISCLYPAIIQQGMLKIASSWIRENLRVSFSVGSPFEESIKNVAVSEAHDRYIDSEHPDDCTFELRTA